MAMRRNSDGHRFEQFISKGLAINSSSSLQFHEGALLSWIYAEKSLSLLNKRYLFGSNTGGAPTTLRASVEHANVPKCGCCQDPLRYEFMKLDIYLYCYNLTLLHPLLNNVH